MDFFNNKQEIKTKIEEILNGTNGVFDIFYLPIKNIQNIDVSCYITVCFKGDIFLNIETPYFAYGEKLLTIKNDFNVTDIFEHAVKVTKEKMKFCKVTKPCNHIIDTFCFFEEDDIEIKCHYCDVDFCKLHIMRHENEDEDEDEDDNFERNN